MQCPLLTFERKLLQLFPDVMTTRGGTRPCLRGPLKTHHHLWLVGPELLGGGLQEGHQDGDQQDVIAQGWLQGSAGGSGHPLRHALKNSIRPPLLL